MIKNALILERSSQNLQKVSKDGKTVLEGVFAVFGEENRNGRIYTEKAYLPHLSYLQEDIKKTGGILGELDHPERFEVALANVSHRIIDIWYDQSQRQVKGRVEILENTPKGQIAKALLEAGVPLSISSRAAGTVNDDKSVDIQQIYTFDLVAKPGFEQAQLYSVNESQQSKLQGLITKLNENYSNIEKDNISKKLGIISENVSIIDLSNKYDNLNIREEAKQLVNKNKINNMNTNKNVSNISEEHIQQWTLFFKNELSKLSEQVSALQDKFLENGVNEEASSQISTLRKQIKELKRVQESALNWQSEMAKGINKIANHSQTIAEKSNEHYKTTQKLVETVDHNAKMLNHVQDWVGNNAKVTNAIAETVDHNAQMVNDLNEWNQQIAKAVNDLNEWDEEQSKAINNLHTWGMEKAKAINGIHEWTSSIAKNLNKTVNYTEDMLGRAISKEDAKKLVEYIEIVAESKTNPELREKINEMLSKHSISEKPLNESLKGIEVLDINNAKTKARKTSTNVSTTVSSDVIIDPKTKAIISKIKSNKAISKGTAPKGIKTLDIKTASTSKITTTSNKGIKVLDKTKVISTSNTDLKKTNPYSSQNLKLDTKPVTKLKESTTERKFDIQSRSSKFDEKLSLIIDNLGKQKAINEQLMRDFPFTSVLSESQREKFASLSQTDKIKVSNEVSKFPSTDANVIEKLWESALTKEISNQPLWLTAAPAKYKSLYDKAPQHIKESIIAKSEFFNLNTEYQITDFWEKTGLTETKITPLNENVVAASKTSKQPDEMDALIATVGEAMKRYNR